MKQPEETVHPSQVDILVCGQELHFNCNGQVINYFETVDHRKYHLHQISLRQGGTRLFSFELMNEQFTAFLKNLIQQNTEETVAILNEILQTMAEDKQKELQVTIDRFNAQMEAIKKAARGY